MPKNFILNSPILTNWGKFKFQPIGLESARKFASEPFTSAIGHESTAKILSVLLGQKIPANRAAIKMQPGDRALVFRLKARPSEGKILNQEEIEEIGYEFGLLTMTACMFKNARLSEKGKKW